MKLNMKYFSTVLSSICDKTVPTYQENLRIFKLAYKFRYHGNEAYPNLECM
jgi:hypothetical protein